MLLGSEPPVCMNANFWGVSPPSTVFGAQNTLHKCVLPLNQMSGGGPEREAEEPG